MLLRNYDNISAIHKIPCIVSVNYFGDNTNYGDGYLSCKSTTGSICKICVYDNYTHSLFNKFSFNGSDFSSTVSRNPIDCTLIAGSGSTPVTYDDYKLENVFTNSQVTKVSQSRTNPSLVDDCWVSTYSVTILAKQDITLSEIGVINYQYIDNGNTKYPFLLYREVLKTPIEVPANSNFVLSFTIKVPTNPNKPANYSASATTE